MVLNSYGNCAGANGNLWSGSNQRLATLDSGASRARYQQEWRSIEATNGVYDWTVMDDYIQTCNRDGTHATLVLQNAPSWHYEPLAADGSKNVPKAADSATFVTAQFNEIATYGGTVYSYEVANEGFDTGNLSNANASAMFQQMKGLLQAVVPVVHSASPNTLIGAPAELNKNGTNINIWTNGFFAAGCHKYVDYVNFHFYPGVAPDSPNAGGYGLKQWLQAWKLAMQTYKVSLPIWITEFGWKMITKGDAAYNSYLTQFMNDVIASNQVQAVYLFDLDSIVPAKQFNSATTYQTYKTWKKFIATTPNFGPTSSQGGGSGSTGTGGGTGGGVGGTGGSSQPTVYFSAYGSTTVQTAGQLLYTGGTPTMGYNLTNIGVGSGYGEMAANGTLTWVNAGSVLPPTGKGSILEKATQDFSGQQFYVAPWAATLTMATMGTTAGTVTCDMHCRAFIYSPANGTYTQLAHMKAPNQKITSTQAQYQLTDTPTTSAQFQTGDLLYVDVWINVTANTGGTDQQIAFYESVDISTPPVGSTTAAVVMPSYIPAIVTPPPPPPPPPPSGGGGDSGGGVGGGSIGGGAGGGFTFNPVPSAVTINGVPFDALAGSLQCEQTIGKRATASFTLLTDTNTHFAQYEQVAIYDSHNNLAFSGYITQPQEVKPGFQPFLLQSITCCDQHFLADKRVVAATYTNKTCGYMAQDILNTLLAQEGLLVGQIYDGIVPDTNLYPERNLYPGGNIGTVPSASFVYCSAAQAFDELVKAASSAGVPYYWMIDQNLQFWFVPYTAVTSNIVVDGTLIDQSPSSKLAQVTWQNPNYRNTQYIIGGTAQTVQQTESRKGDGTTTAWTMGYAIAAVPFVQVNSVTKTVGIKGLDTGKNFYWSAGDPVITQDSAGTKLVSTDTLTVAYYGQYPTVIIAQNGAQVSYQASVDGSTGIVEQVVQDQTITSVPNGQFEAGQLLSRYGMQGAQLQFDTQRYGFAPGQLITVNLPDHNLANVQMLIEKVTASDQKDTLNIWYTVTAISGPYDTTWVDFFSALLRQQAPANSINIGVGQAVVLSSSFTASLTPSIGLTATPYACPLPGTTQVPKTNLYPC